MRISMIFIFDYSIISCSSREAIPLSYWTLLFPFLCLSPYLPRRIPSSQTGTYLTLSRLVSPYGTLYSCRLSENPCSGSQYSWEIRLVFPLRKEVRSVSFRIRNFRRLKSNLKMRTVFFSNLLSIYLFVFFGMNWHDFSIFLLYCVDEEGVQIF